MLKKHILPAVAHLFLIASFISLLPVWLGDLFSHFRVFWTVCSVFLLILYVIFLKQRKVKVKVVGTLFLSLLINFIASKSFWTNSQTYNYLFLGSPNKVEISEKLERQIQNDTTTKSLLLMNILSSNTNYEEVKRTIKNTDADFVVILELNEEWETELEELKSVYPYEFLDVREDNFGMGIYAKTSFIDSDIILNSKGLNELNKELNDGLAKWNSGKDVNILDVAKLNGVQMANPAIFVKDETINILLLHPTPPISITKYRERNKYLDTKISFMKGNSNAKTLFVGDLNCSSFSADYKNFLAKSNLKDSQENFGFQPTWNASFPFLMQTQLDHVWHSKEIEVLHRQTLPIKGSDHKAVYVVFR